MLAWVNGLQRDGGRGDSGGPDLALATCKHWSGYSLEGQIKKTASNPPGTYPGRHSFDALVNKQDLVDFYFPVFESCTKDASIASVMCSYNSVAIEGENIHDGIPSCANSRFNNGILRSRWNFSGLMVSDWCVGSKHLSYNFNRSPLNSAAALQHGDF
jgi:beta-glucosidase-like glycosyl hydrolase